MESMGSTNRIKARPVNDFFSIKARPPRSSRRRCTNRQHVCWVLGKKRPNLTAVRQQKEQCHIMSQCEVKFALNESDHVKIHQPCHIPAIWWSVAWENSMCKSARPFRINAGFSRSRWLVVRTKIWPQDGYIMIHQTSSWPCSDSIWIVTLTSVWESQETFSFADTI